MATLEGTPVTINKPAREVYDFLGDFRNFGTLMPEQVEWEATSEECSFTIKGMGTFGMKYKQKIPNTLIEVERNGKAPVDFILRCKITGEEKSEVKFEFDAELNPVMKMLAERPLTNFVNLLATKLQEFLDPDKRV